VPEPLLEIEGLTKRFGGAYLGEQEAIVSHG